MAATRKLHLCAFLKPVSLHGAGWRYPGAWADANLNIGHLKALAQQLERSCFDAVFTADHLALLNMPMEALQRSHTVSTFEPLTLLSALAASTDRIGLVGTVSTSFEQPYHVARRFASLDHISGGRAGWNVVTTYNPDAARNFGNQDLREHDDRYRLAHEFHTVVRGLWDSWADDAFIRDQATGLYFDPARLQVLDYQSPEFAVRGPLNIARPIQGAPVIFQAGASEAGRQLAAETAEVIFGSETTLEGACSFYADIQRRLLALGRPELAIRIMPGAMIIMGETMAEAQVHRARLDSLVDYAQCLPTLSRLLGCDASGFAPDDPLPEIPQTNESQSTRAFVLELASREGLTVRQLAQRLGGYGGLTFVGTATSIADEMEHWLNARGADGFNILFPHVPLGVADVTDRLVPELQRRSLFRTNYEGATLREHLRLPQPGNAFFRLKT
ncbi:LLM class flavin-dependent oxidoreductase [Novosphingobium sp. AP12]|uniref:LLM class flavin-dependent oxidoreductase n=1 Tax=Novosphingobium sp. AP12 TaxID=1144305 RepID=UPI000271E314|nr:LLM class flavin-dependent oxidoreductase [Novosphingobium sp. AP12]EJL20235.1 flavin-dependent oxidoreductase, methylene-tetrahydromethanopterin reductase [Novosphingobium sp. AP12]